LTIKKGGIAAGLKQIDDIFIQKYYHRIAAPQHKN